MNKETSTYLLMVLLGVLAYAYPQVEIYRILLCLATIAIVGSIWLIATILFALSFVLDKPLKYSPNGRPLLSRSISQWGMMITKMTIMTWLYNAIGWHNTAGAYFVGTLVIIAILLHLEHKLGYVIKGE